MESFCKHGKTVTGFALKLSIRPVLRINYRVYR
jgi:hypothetical protein